MPDLSSEAIDFRVAFEFLKPIRKLTVPGLQSLEITMTHQGRVVPTIGGILLFGSTRVQHFPEAWIQVGRFAERGRRRIVDSTEVRSYLPGATEEVIAFLHKDDSRSRH
jgi:predicted HTH transcriptional regulator